MAVVAAARTAACVARAPRIFLSWLLSVPCARLSKACASGRRRTTLCMAKHTATGDSNTFSPHACACAGLVASWAPRLCRPALLRIACTSIAASARPWPRAHTMRAASARGRAGGGAGALLLLWAARQHALTSRPCASACALRSALAQQLRPAPYRAQHCQYPSNILARVPSACTASPRASDFMSLGGAWAIPAHPACGFAHPGQVYSAISATHAHGCGHPCDLLLLAARLWAASFCGAA